MNSNYIIVVDNNYFLTSKCTLFTYEKFSKNINLIHQLINELLTVLNNLVKSFQNLTIFGTGIMTTMSNNCSFAV